MIIRVSGISPSDWKFILFYIAAVGNGTIRPNFSPFPTKVFQRPWQC